MMNFTRKPWNWLPDAESIKRALGVMGSAPEFKQPADNTNWGWWGIPSSRDVNKRMQRYRIRRRKLNRIAAASRRVNRRRAA